MRSLIFYLKGLVIISLISCQAEHTWYNRQFNPEEKSIYSQKLMNGVSYHYQGSVPAEFHLKEALQLDSSNGDLWRELGTARVKRGIANEMEYYYGRASELKPDPWIGFRGYLYLYFYRDYPRAIADFNFLDSISGTVNYSQGQNHDYMRGIAYYGFKDYSQALYSLSLYIDSTITNEGEEWVDVFAVLYRALTYEKLEDQTKMKGELQRALRIYPALADAQFHLARLAYRGGEKLEAQELIKQAEENFKEGYFHNRPYVEVLEQLYLEDITQLKDSIELSMPKLKDEPAKMFPD